jgi:hypothetical protein
MAAIEAARGSMIAAGAAITRATGVTIGKRRVEELARRCAVHVEAFYARRVTSPAPDGWPLILTFDGKGIVMLPEAEEWVADQARKILRGKSAQVAAGIRRRATTYGYSPAECAGADECARYLDSKKDHLGYATALRKGWPIATGIIEGACRHIVKDRMDITGARWGLEGAEAILKLRSLIATGDFEDYWRFHLRREHERIHHAKYRETHVLAA